MVLYAAAETLDITPRAPCEMGGNGHPGSSWETIDSQLEANLLMLTDGTRRVLLITLDLLYVGEALVASIREHLAPYIDPDCVMLAASHTHRAPMTDPNKPVLGTPSEGYFAAVLSRLRRASTELLQGDTEPVEMFTGSGRVPMAVNRRRRGRLRLTGEGLKTGGVSLAPNPTGPVDDRGAVAEFRRPNGSRVATVWTYACHPTSYPTSTAVTADFPGEVRRVLRRDENTPVLYLQGFSGNLRPPAITRLRDAPLRRARLGPHFRDFRSDEWRAWTVELARRIEGITLRRVVAERIETRVTRLPSEVFVARSRTPYLELQAVAVGRTVLCAASAEVVTEYSASIRSALPDLDVWPVSCTADVLAYLTTDEQRELGGYEAVDYCRNLNCDGSQERYQATLESAMRDLCLSVC